MSTHLHKRLTAASVGVQTEDKSSSPSLSFFSSFFIFYIFFFFIFEEKYTLLLVSDE